MSTLPIWLEIALILCVIASITCAVVIQIRGPRPDDTLSWKIIAMVAAPVAIILTVALTMLATKKSRSESPTVPGANPRVLVPDPSDHSEEAIALREALTTRAEDEAHHIRVEATDDEVAARAAGMFDPKKPTG